jgi:hypothetical protein
LFAEIASVIDREIYQHYRLFPCNYIAYDLLNNSIHSGEYYNDKDLNDFEDYLQKQLAKIDIPNKDEPYLRSKMLEMYANPLKNQLENANDTKNAD